MPKTVKGGPLRFFNNHSVAKFQKNEGEPIGVKKMRIFNSLIVLKNLKEGTLWDFFNNRSVAKYQNKLKGGPFEDIKRTLKNFSKKSLTKPKREESHSAEKVRTFCFGILVKKISAYSRVRTRTLWVEKQASYH